MKEGKLYWELGREGEPIAWEEEAEGGEEEEEEEGD